MRNVFAGSRRRTNSISNSRGPFRRIARFEWLEKRLLLAADLLGPGDGLEKTIETIANVDLTLTPPGDVNTMDVVLTAEAFGNTLSDSDTATVTGNMIASLGIALDPATQEVAGVEQLEFTGGTIRLSDVFLELNFGFLIGKITASGTGIAGSPDTPVPPGTVVGDEFDTAEHQVTLDQGNFHAVGSGFVLGGLFPETDIDLSETPIEATSQMTGYIDVSLQSVDADTATYDVAVSLPVDFTEEVYSDESFSATVSIVGTLVAEGQFTRDIPGPEVVGRHVFYNNSAFDGGPNADADDERAIDRSKTALLPGETATFDNYTGYSRGINGIMVDVSHLPGDVTAADFVFKVGNDSDPADWTPVAVAPDITVCEGAGDETSDRVTVIWPDNLIQKQWLQVTVLATDNTGLEVPDVFYFGNAVGESGNSTAEAGVNAVDVLLARNNPQTLLDDASIGYAYDYNHDRRVNATDMLIARQNQTHLLNELKAIAVPYEFELMGTSERPSKKDRAAAEAIDRLLQMPTQGPQER